MTRILLVEYSDRVTHLMINGTCLTINQEEAEKLKEDGVVRYHNTGAVDEGDGKIVPFITYTNTL